MQETTCRRSAAIDTGSCRRCAAALATLLLALIPLAVLKADEPSNETDSVVLPTLGGKQFWADELFFHQWRIQRNVLTGHCRLLDGNNQRHAWGSFDFCRAQLEQIKRQQKLPPMQGKAVIVLHGLGRSRSSMDRLCKYLQDRGSYTIFNVGYASTQGEIGTHARALRRIIENLDGIEEINFVAHSMGNIVIRRYLAGEAVTPPPAADPRIKRFVMLAPPNHGSLAALVLADNVLFKTVTGESGQLLGRDWDHLEGKLATPPFEFGIVAGGKGNDKGFNPLLPGDNDGTISVSTARLSGAADFVILPVRHACVVDDAQVQEYTLRFLHKGHFVSPQRRQPIAKE